MLSHLAVLLDQAEQSFFLLLFGAYQEGGVAFLEEAAGRAYDRELESVSDQVFDHPPLVSVVHDGDDEFQNSLLCPCERFEGALEDGFGALLAVQDHETLRVQSRFGEEAFADSAVEIERLLIKAVLSAFVGYSA